jgi:small multidrug resistance pump
MFERFAEKMTSGGVGLAVSLTVGLSLMGVVADWLLKMASQQASAVGNRWFAAGALAYGLTAFPWVYVMRHLKLAQLGVIYCVTTALALAVLGTAGFRESMRPTEWLGLGMAVCSLFLMGRFL